MPGWLGLFVAGGVHRLSFMRCDSSAPLQGDPLLRRWWRNRIFPAIVTTSVFLAINCESSDLLQFHFQDFRCSKAGKTQNSDLSGGAVEHKLKWLWPFRLISALSYLWRNPCNGSGLSSKAVGGARVFPAPSLDGQLHIRLLSERRIHSSPTHSFISPFLTGLCWLLRKYLFNRLGIGTRVH